MLTAFWVFAGIMIFIVAAEIIITLLGIWGVPMDFVDGLIKNDWFVRIFLTMVVIIGLLTIFLEYYQKIFDK